MHSTGQCVVSRERDHRSAEKHVWPKLLLQVRYIHSWRRLVDCTGRASSLILLDKRDPWHRITQARSDLAAISGSSTLYAVGMTKLPPPAVVAVAEAARNGLDTLKRSLVPPPIALLDVVNDFWAFHVAFALAV